MTTVDGCLDNREIGKFLSLSFYEELGRSTLVTPWECLLSFLRQSRNVSPLASVALVLLKCHSDYNVKLF